MPIYEYQCEACKHVFENLQKITDAPLTRCPDCGAEALKKLVSAPAFRLKGGGNLFEAQHDAGRQPVRHAVRPGHLTIGGAVHSDDEYWV